MNREHLEGRIVALQSLCVILLDQHCRDHSIPPDWIASKALKSQNLSEFQDAAEGYDSEIDGVLQQLKRLHHERPYRTE